MTVRIRKQTIVTQGFKRRTAAMERQRNAARTYTDHEAGNLHFFLNNLPETLWRNCRQKRPIKVFAIGDGPFCDFDPDSDLPF